MEVTDCVRLLKILFANMPNLTYTDIKIKEVIIAEVPMRKKKVFNANTNSVEVVPEGSPYALNVWYQLLDSNGGVVMDRRETLKHEAIPKAFERVLKNMLEKSKTRLMEHKKLT